MNNQQNKPRCALVMTGGGARAAYQVGVLKAISEQYPRNHACPFTILAGTSAGAINATALGVYASCFRLGVKKLEYIWRNFECQHVFETHITALLKQVMSISFGSLRADYARERSLSLLDNRPLQQLLDNYLNYQRIDTNIHNKHLHALAVTCSDYVNGNSISFYQAQPEQQNWQRAKRIGKKHRINTKHLLGSASIPLIFPPAQVGAHYYGDGSINQLSPLSPAIHLGADKILTIQLQHPPSAEEQIHPHLPNASTIAGHLLNSIFSDTLNSDIERLDRINKTIDKVNPKQQKKLNLRKIETFNIVPSINFDSCAHEHYHVLPLSIRILFACIGIKAHIPSAITSFLMFESAYTQSLISAGYHDAMQQIDEIIKFIES